MKLSTLKLPTLHLIIILTTLAPSQGEPATVAVSAPIISANDPAPYAAPYNPAPSYGSGGQAPRQPPRQYGNDEQVLKQVSVLLCETVRWQVL